MRASWQEAGYPHRRVRGLTALLVLALLVAGCEAAASPAAAVDQPQESSSPSPALTAAHPDSPELAVAEFYKWYTAYPGNPLVRQSYRTNEFLRPYLSDEIIEKADQTLASSEGRAGGFDPFLCSQDMPANFEYELLEQEGDQARVLVQRYYVGDPQAYEMAVDLVRRAGRWLILDIRCIPSGGEAAGAQPLADEEPARLPGTSTPLPGEWITYVDRGRGFQFDYPVSWLPHETAVSEPLDVDPIDAYILFSAPDAAVPVALMVSTGSMESFRTFFPEPADGATERINGYEVLVEQHFGQERYYIFLHPENPEQRVALRVISREQPLDASLQGVVEKMLASFAYLD